MPVKRVADILVDDLIRFGLSQVFLITGGGAMHLNDAFGRRRGELSLCHQHHEQASSMAADAYFRITGKPAVVQVTTGPGGLNALNGVYGAWTDSAAMIVISGQIKRETMLRNMPCPLRQMGDQETDIISLVRPITKYAVELQDPRRVREAVSKAVYAATHGRPGPVWLDIPIDVSSTLLNPLLLPVWNAEEPGALADLRGDPNLHPNALGDFTEESDAALERKAEILVSRLKAAERPVLLAGTGVHAAKAEAAFLDLAEKLHVPAVAGWGAYDLIPSSHPCYAGRPGTVGDRPGNITVQNADFLLTLGCRLNIRQISYNWQSFAPHAWKAHVDIDPAELAKPTLSTDLAIHADLRRFLPALEKALKHWTPKPAHEHYRSWCRDRVKKYPVLTEKHKAAQDISPYYFLHRVFSLLEPGDVVVTANGAVSIIGPQVGEIKPGVRIISNSGCASMGFELPAATGAALAGARRVICLAGDGSIMMNLQELQTLSGLKLPVLILLLNNDGYLSIRMTQNAYFGDNLFGTGPENGVTFPNFQKVASAFDIPVQQLRSRADVDSRLEEIFRQPLPALCEVIVDKKHGIEPRLASRKLNDGTMLTPALDDMAPFLSQKELAANRIDTDTQGYPR